MKTVCKKLLSLMLVAVLLVSAVPMMASAAGSGNVVVHRLDTSEQFSIAFSDLTTSDNVNYSIPSHKVEELKKNVNVSGVKGWSRNEGDSSGGKLDSLVFTKTEVDGNNNIDIYAIVGASVTPPKHEHTWNSGVVNTAATCTTDGVMTYTCTDPSCGATKTEKIAATGHTYGDPQITVAATCGKDGTQTKTCTACGATVTETIKATGNHTWGGWVIQSEATATAEGTMIRTCSVCAATETQKYSAETKEINFQITTNGNTTTTKSVFVINKAMSLPKPSVPAGYKFKGWFSEPNGKGTQLTEGTTCTANLANVYYAYFTENVKFDYNIYLNIYSDNKVDEPAKRITITNGIAKDGVVTLAEVKGVVFDYYTAKDSNGITFDGLYMATGNWVDKFNKNDKFDTVDVSELKEQNNVFINVMITNAKAKSSSSSNADSSNPKTGDSIYTAVAVMGLSVTALAAVYFINKKRIAY